MKLRILALVFAMILTMCSCSSKDNTSSGNDNTTPSTVSLPTTRSWSYDDKFKYTSLDELVSKVEANGVEEFCKCKEYEGRQDVRPAYSPEYRHNEAEKILNASLYEVYYKGKKLDVYEPIELNIRFNYYYMNGRYWSESFCEYFVEYTDEQYGDCMKFLAFLPIRLEEYEVTAVEAFWDIGYSDLYSISTKIKIQFHGKETECLVIGGFDEEIGKWQTVKLISLKLDDQTVVCLDVGYSDAAEKYLDSAVKDGVLSSETKRELYSNFYSDLKANNTDADYFFQNIENYLNSFEFKKVNITLPQ